MSNAGSIVDNSLCVSNRDSLDSVDVASMGDFDSEDFDYTISFDSENGSVAELEWNTWYDVCVWEFQNASGDFPPDSVLATPAVLLKDILYLMEDGGIPEWDGCWTGLDFCKCRHKYVDGDIYFPRLCLLDLILLNVLRPLFSARSLLAKLGR